MERIEQERIAAEKKRIEDEIKEKKRREEERIAAEKAAEVERIRKEEERLEKIR